MRENSLMIDDTVPSVNVTDCSFSRKSLSYRIASSAAKTSDA